MAPIFPEMFLILFIFALRRLDNNNKNRSKYIKMYKKPIYIHVPSLLFLQDLKDILKYQSINK